MIERFLTSPRLYWLFRIGWLEHFIFKAIRFFSHFTRPIDKALQTNLFGFDFSKWQGVIDFAKVWLYGTKFVILRAADGLVQDIKFTEYMQTVIEHFTGRLSIYHYYRPGVDPVVQANKLIAIIYPYKHLIKRVWGDFEFSESGSYSAPANWKKYAETIVAAGFQFGVYTRATWWDSRVGTFAMWFSQFPLWAAQYAPALTLIPRGWTRADLWQTGTPAIGAEVGTQSLEVDHDIADDVFYRSEYNGGTVEPPPTGPVKIKTIRVFSNGSIVEV